MEKVRSEIVPPYYNHPFRKNLKEARKKAGYKTQETFSEAMDVTVESVRNWEQGRTIPEMKTLLKIVELLDCDMDYLIGRIQESSHTRKYIQEQTGLSEQVISLLQKWNTSDDRKKLWPEYLTKIITDERFSDLMCHITDMMCHAHIEGLAFRDHNGHDIIEEINGQAAQEWYVSHVLTNILESMTTEERLKYSRK